MCCVVLCCVVLCCVVLCCVHPWFASATVSLSLPRRQVRVVPAGGSGQYVFKLADDPSPSTLVVRVVTDTGLVVSVAEGHKLLWITDRLTTFNGAVDSHTSLHVAACTLCFIAEDGAVWLCVVSLHAVLCVRALSRVCCSLHDSRRGGSTSQHGVRQGRCGGRGGACPHSHGAVQRRHGRSVHQLRLSRQQHQVRPMSSYFVLWICPGCVVLCCAVLCCDAM